jgi:hypothetical protein
VTSNNVYECRENKLGKGSVQEKKHEKDAEAFTKKESFSTCP